MKFKYWLTSLTDISNAKKKLLHDCSITAEKLFFMPKNEPVSYTHLTLPTKA